MKNLYLFFWLLLSSYMIFAQDTIYYNFDDIEVNSKIECHYFKVKQFDSVTNLYQSRSFDSTGTLLRITHFSDINYDLKEGVQIEYYSNESIKSQIFFSKDVYHGSFKTFYKGGQLKRSDFYNEGELVKGACYDSTGKEIKYFEYMIMPEFPKGEEALNKYLKKSLKYPIEAIDNGIRGKVTISFTIDKDGSVINTIVLDSVHPLLDNEALRVIKNMPKWKPGKVDGELVKVTFSIPFAFNL